MCALCTGASRGGPTRPWPPPDEEPARPTHVLASPKPVSIHIHTHQHLYGVNCSRFQVLSERQTPMAIGDPLTMSVINRTRHRRRCRSFKIMFLFYFICECEIGPLWRKTCPNPMTSFLARIPTYVYLAGIPTLAPTPTASRWKILASPKRRL